MAEKKAKKPAKKEDKKPAKPAKDEKKAVVVGVIEETTEESPASEGNLSDGVLDAFDTDEGGDDLLGSEEDMDDDEDEADEFGREEW
jgi:hypothetical protein